jgi:hypothetical protein
VRASLRLEEIFAGREGKVEQLDGLVLVAVVPFREAHEVRDEKVHDGSDRLGALEAQRTAIERLLVD